MTATSILRSGTRAWLCAALMALSLEASAQAVADGPARFAQALGAYEIGHFERAFGELALLADEGHCEAARIARQMQRFGRGLYGTEFKPAPARVQRWLAAACAPAAR